jgi:hypothetical protein
MLAVEKRHPAIMAANERPLTTCIIIHHPSSPHRASHRAACDDCLDRYHQDLFTLPSRAMVHLYWLLCRKSGRRSR